MEAQRDADSRPPAGGGERKGQGGNDGAPPDERGETTRRPWYKRPGIMAIVFVVVMAIAVGGTWWWMHSRHYESTDDALLDAVWQEVSPQVEGRVVRVFVQDNQPVARGDALVDLDPTDYQSRLDQAQAAAAQARAGQQQSRAQHAVAEGQLEQARARADVAETNLANARGTLRRLEEAHLANAGAASQQQLDDARDAARTAEAQVEVARKGIAAAQAQVDLAGSQIAAAAAEQKSAAAQVEQAKLALSYTHVRAEIDGRVAHKTVAVGNYVKPGTALMAVVPNDLYVTAHFKETQLTRLRAGQPAEIKIDAYPDLEVTGHVDSVQPATGDTFSVIPAQNASGNWVKVVQRVPVKITLDRIADDPGETLGPGMSVEVTVTVEQ